MTTPRIPRNYNDDPLVPVMAITLLMVGQGLIWAVIGYLAAWMIYS